MAGGVSVLIIDKGVPEHAAISVSFADENSKGGSLSGTVNVSVASDERDISHYVLYWGDAQDRKVLQEPVAVLEKRGSNILYRLPDDTQIPAGATSLIVFTKNADGEMGRGVSVQIVDIAAPSPTAGDITEAASGAPVATATAVSFEDTAPRGRILDGIISISRAADERSLTHYVIYWGSDAQTVVPETQPIVSFSKVLPDLTFRITPIYGRPAGATHFLVKTKNERGEMASGVSVLIVDKSVPEHAAISVSFADENSKGGSLSGTVNVSVASDERDISHYVLYWGDAEDRKVIQEPVAVLEKRGSNILYRLPDDTQIPAGATSLIVFTKNADGEMGRGVSVQIVDISGAASTAGIASCNFAAGMCVDVHSAAAAEQLQASCDQRGGTYSSSSVCPGVGKLVGCEQVTVQGKLMTEWVYTSELQQMLSIACPLKNKDGVSATLVAAP